jgi:3-(3-hydroxy-phenyl)propionate hydroxylase
MMSGLDLQYDLGEGHPLLGRRMPDLDLVTEGGPLRVFTLLHDARPVLLNLGEPGGAWTETGRPAQVRSGGCWRHRDHTFLCLVPSPSWFVAAQMNAP